MEAAARFGFFFNAKNVQQAIGQLSEESLLYQFLKSLPASVQHLIKENL